MSHEGDGIPIVLYQVSSENLPDGGHRMTYRCSDWADYFCMPSGIVIGPWKYEKVRHDMKNGVAIYEAEPPTERSLRA